MRRPARRGWTEDDKEVEEESDGDDVRSKVSGSLVGTEVEKEFIV